MDDIVVVESPEEFTVVTVGETGPRGPGGGGSGDLSDATPLMNGTAGPGVAEEASRSDHVHPVDTSRAPASHVGAGGTAHANAVAAGAAGFMTGADKTKLDGIAAGATANATDAQLRDRATHTGSQAIGTVSGLQAALDAKVDDSQISAFGLTLVDDADAAAARTTLGLGTAATTAAAAYATAAQGVKADSAVQPGDLAAVATSGDVNDLVGFPGGTTNFLRADGTFNAPAGGGSGDVVGPASSVNNRVALFDGTTGKLLKDSGLTLSGSNTGDQTSVTGNAGTATALATSRNIDGQAFNGTADITVIAPGTVAATGKTTPVDADVMPLADSAASNVLKKVTWANIKATLKTYFDTLYSTFVNPMTTAGDLIVGGASGAAARLAKGTAYQLLRMNSGATAAEWGGALQCIAIACSDETTALTTGTAKVTFRMPFAFTLTGVRSSATTAPTGSVLTVDINEAGTTILSTKLTIDATEKTSTTAATPAVISDASLADDAEITIDIDAIGSTIAGAGLKVYLIGYPT
ncbi:hypothetical protein C7T35_01460 [Variovorax sp. WS11]|uniref:hypothetical protein n=1 Tax=Variovorax sp. WS11 TaxID=1105204 RepID=UPI000D0D3CB2|nr:hypothetical protein [Variovorax sp. WS11]NDZ11480.1 hypothetical protein [Variovorax sp. WS11]PSL86662.1 hypothetical protein C7T35_01460 [Variovorax sp. WS11]